LAPLTAETSLARRLFYISLPIALLAGVIYAGALVYLETKSLNQTQQTRVVEQISQLAEVMAIPTWNLDQQFISSYLKQNSVSPYIQCIELISDASLKESSPQDCQHAETGITLHSEPIVYEELYIGVIIVSYKIELDNERLKFILWSRIPMAVFALLTVFFSVFWVFRRWVVIPLQQMTQSIETFQVDGTVMPIRWESKDEIGTLNKTINKAQQQQQTHDRILTSAKEKAESSFNELQSMQSQLVESEKMASLGGLVAGISHEINTPLGVAKTSASHVEDELKKMTNSFSEGTLTKSSMEDFINQFSDGLHLLTANLNRASELMTSFKQVSADQSHDEMRTINLKEYLEETIYTLKPNLRRYQVAVLLDCEDNILIDTFPGAFSQITTNLIMNSLNHAYAPEDPGSINITVTQANDLVLLTYNDDGKGMEESVLKKVFEPFFTTKRGNGGTGLGMHIIYNLVTMKLQGTIDVSSVVGQGSTFKLILPTSLTPPEPES
jgi:two-component system NtrC family sensor kinase